MARRNPEREKHWESLLTQWHNSDQIISTFCQQRNLSKPTFGYWQRKLGFVRWPKPRSSALTYVPMTVVAEPQVEVVVPAGVILKLPLTAGEEPIQFLPFRSKGPSIPGYSMKIAIGSPCAKFVNRATVPPLAD